jgi:hypothetical protein
VNQNRRESNIERWETVAVIMSETTVTGDGSEIGVSLVINQPVFKDGNLGFPKASIVIERNKSVYRIPFFKGSDEEPCAIVDLVNSAIDVWQERGEEDFKSYVTRHREYLDELKKKRIDEHNDMMDNLASSYGKDNSRVNTGLGRFTKESKRDRVKRKRDHQQSDIE